MSDMRNERFGDDRGDNLTEALDAVGAAHDAVPRGGSDVFLASIQRICVVAERMLTQGNRRACAENQTAPSPPSLHPLGAIAEHLAAKTIASFGGRGAVQDLRKWMLRAER